MKKARRDVSNRAGKGRSVGAAADSGKFFLARGMAVAVGLARSPTLSRYANPYPAKAAVFRFRGGAGFTATAGPSASSNNSGLKAPSGARSAVSNLA